MAAEPVDQEYRRSRLLALLALPEVGGASGLARMLGYKVPSYVQQLAAKPDDPKHRSIGEKFIHKVEALHGGKWKGWFAVRAAHAEPWTLDPFVSRKEWLSLSDAERGAVAWEAKKALDTMRAAQPGAEKKAKGQKAA